MEIPAWKTEKPYAVVHRMAFSSRVRGGGLSRNVFQLLKDFCRLNCIDAIRLDTQEENKVMQHILSRELGDIIFCGLCNYSAPPIAQKRTGRLYTTIEITGDL